MRERLTPLIPAVMSLLLAACATQPTDQTQWMSGDSARDAVQMASRIQVLDGPAMAPSSDDDSAAPSAITTAATDQRHSPSFSELLDFDASPAAALPDAVHEDVLPPTVERILARAEELIGTPYRWGGTTPRGFDCSGFVNFLFHEEAGIELPRSTRDLMAMSKARVAKEQLQPGDIILFNRNGRGRVSHTGIYIGDNQFIHSSSHRSGGVRIDSLEERYWRKSYLTAKRVLD
ncbi:MAG: C40 family peptidase [Gammaproteobacteria bacterium]|nr:C40 family peptidase [Gammaproteobacteria bacterium]